MAEVCRMNQVRRIILCWGVLMALPSFHAQVNVHLIGIMPTVDVGVPLGEHWSIENYTFACVLPFEQTRPSFLNPTSTENYGPGSAAGESRSIRSLVFAYTEFDVTRTLSESWSLTGSYTHEWVPLNSSVWGAGERYIRDEHRIWLQSKYKSKSDAGWAWWWRMRWDQRWIETDPYEQTAARWTSRPRLREQLGFALPIGETTLSGSSEVFVEAWDGGSSFSGIDRFREAWTTLQYGAFINESVRWEAGPLVVSWKQFSDTESLGWTHFWYLQATAFFKLGR